jgi:hypothetical protein
MAMRTTPPFLEEAQLRVETEQRRAAYQAQLERDRRLMIGVAGLVLVIGASAMIAIAGTFG